MDKFTVLFILLLLSLSQQIYARHNGSDYCVLDGGRFGMLVLIDSRGELIKAGSNCIAQLPTTTTYTTTYNSHDEYGNEFSFTRSYSQSNPYWHNNWNYRPNYPHRPYPHRPQPHQKLKPSYRPMGKYSGNVESKPVYGVPNKLDNNSSHRASHQQWHSSPPQNHRPAAPSSSRGYKGMGLRR